MATLPCDNDRISWYCRGHKINSSVEGRKCRMMSALGKHIANWNANPRRFEIKYILSRLKGFSLAALHLRDPYRLKKYREKLMMPVIEAECVNILLDREFQNSVVIPEYDGFFTMRARLPFLISHPISQPN